MLYSALLVFVILIVDCYTDGLILVLYYFTEGGKRNLADELTEKELFQRVNLTHSADREKSLHLLSTHVRFMETIEKIKGALARFYHSSDCTLAVLALSHCNHLDPLTKTLNLLTLPARIPGLFNGYRNGVDV